MNIEDQKKTKHYESKPHYCLPHYRVDTIEKPPGMTSLPFAVPFYTAPHAHTHETLVSAAPYNSAGSPLQSAQSECKTKNKK